MPRHECTKHLAKFYIFKKLLELYFNITDSKLLLPNTLQALITEITYLFLFLPKDRTNFKKHI